MILDNRFNGQQLNFSFKPCQPCVDLKQKGCVCDNRRRADRGPERNKKFFHNQNDLTVHWSM